eukprot:12145746-Alexandrium_andersonii.AAC.1
MSFLAAAVLVQSAVSPAQAQLDHLGDHGSRLGRVVAGDWALLVAGGQHRGVPSPAGARGPGLRGGSAGSRPSVAAGAHLGRRGRGLGGGRERPAL